MLLPKASLSALDFELSSRYQQSMLLGELIDINTNELPKMYKRLYQSSKRCLLLPDSYQPTPVEVYYW
ncbi:hypothetical protein [Thiomicrorhabdus arctica]|jgi:CxxC motif-containing protein (DUF1111 family)|uniref:hypothetical protein n=1 Tax=Thiomicrorhabdus arctica TaxID=131540 RepID=UPI00036BEC3E|nr:hypothetical protein [Thiomicrorhabdus arctica]